MPSLFFRGTAFCTERSASEGKAVWERHPWTCLASSYFSKIALLLEGFFPTTPKKPQAQTQKSQESLVNGIVPAMLHLMSTCTSSLGAACRQHKAGMV